VFRRQAMGVSVRGSAPVGIGCLCILIALGFNALIGGLCFQVCLWSLIGKDAPWYLDGLAGMFASPVVVPLAVVCWVVRACGVGIPFFHVG
jgi:hypothetical protein